MALLSKEERKAGVVACSSGNHGRALAWAARRAGVAASIFLPEDAYPNKIEAIRREGAEAVICPTRGKAELACAEAVQRGATLVHPYDSWKTIEGASTVGLEIGEDWPEVDCVVVPVGGGGLASGILLGLRAALMRPTHLVGVEPEGARNMALALEAGKSTTLESVETVIQGLCPLSGGRRNWEVLSRGGAFMASLSDRTILDAQLALGESGDWPVEPAGAAAAAWVLSGGLEKGDLVPWEEAAKPFRVAAIVSGGNCEPPSKGE